ncbi:hypothetical protein AVEN_230001-1 [Araneus ventricosus]|uniref:Tc1-like transposase DDE domain-containing protein n=1 Tax=Araneus ventricosus TaxID=182803 RepID=A0A4Y2CTW8_ARAVE|nr:hypothetical protein AVEN_230001-1 [Araneus ventricosus]
MQVSMQGDQLCVPPPQRKTEKGPFMLGKRRRSLDQTAMGFCTLHRRVQIHTGERFRAFAGISRGGHTDLRVFHGGTLTGVRYWDEIFDPYACPYAGAIGNDFILMDDNTRPHRAVVVEGHGLERMESLAQSPDLNPIENLWDYLGRQVAALSLPAGSLDELEQGLLRVWSSLPISVTNKLIDSMESR